MADNDTSKIRYDDFIGNVQPDPAKPEATIMLSGFVGHGPEGHARVYPDPTLGTWYDIPEGDVVHSIPIPDSKLGGSYLWVRASSEIKPGSAAPAATEAEAVQPQQPAAALQPTPTVQTHCFICPPHTQNCTPATICTLHGHCPPQPSAAPMLCTERPHTLLCSWLCGAAAVPAMAAAAVQPTPTVQTHCFICPPYTQAVHCWTAPVVCDTMQMPTLAPRAAFSFAPTLCPGPFTMHCTLLCPPEVRAAAAPQQANATAVTVCVTDCQQPGNQMMKAAVGVNPMDPTPQSLCFVCDQKMAAAMQPTPTAQTHCFICPPHTQAVHCWTAPVVCDTMQMPTPATRCFICPPVNQTLATVCTQVGCPTHQIHCPTQPVVCNLQPTQPVVCGVLPPSFGCQQQGGAQPQHLAMAAPAHPNTAATLCTQAPACPPHTVHNSMCICPTPSAVHQCGGQTFTPTIPQFTLFGACPTVGACPSIACGFTPVQNGVFTPFGR
jgi:hypothetical protein